MLLSLTVPPPRNPTVADIAAASGFSKSAVCAALKGRSNVPLLTRNKIVEVARELGYHADSQLSKLMSYLRNHREVAGSSGFLVGKTAGD